MLRPTQNGRIRRQRVDVRQKIARLIHDVDRHFAIRNSHVHVQAEDQIGARHLLHVLHDRLVALAFRDALIVPMRKRMRAGGGEFRSAAAGQFRQFAAQTDHLLARFRRGAANIGPGFHDRLMHLRLDPFLHHDLAVAQDLLDVRLQLARLRIDDLELFLDAEGEDVVFLHRLYQAPNPATAQVSFRLRAAADKERTRTANASSKFAPKATMPFS